MKVTYMNNFFTLCLHTILEPDPTNKAVQARELGRLFAEGLLSYTHTSEVISIPTPGIPTKLKLVEPRYVARRRLGSADGIASLAHALAHIEYNAINLALDACYRFQDMPHEYYANWLKVALDEVSHFEMLQQHLGKLGYSYGDFTAHNGLWDMALRTEKDIISRMALVPRVLEARGLDAVPEIQYKLQHSGDAEFAKILSIIHQDEITHVSYGDKWFKYCCNQQGLDSEATFFDLLQRYDAPKIRGAFNRDDRKKAGFSDSELDRLLILAKL